MRWLDALRLRLRSVFKPAIVERELDAELAFFVEARTEEHIAAGMKPADARVAALRSVGSLSHVKDQCREARGLGWLEDLTQDARYTSRALRRHPAFTLVAIATLALGVGANTAIFSFLDNVLLKPLPYPDPDRIVRVSQKLPNGETFPITTQDFLDWQQQQTVFEFVAASRGWTASLSGEDEPVLLRGLRVSPSYYEVSRVTPLLGRTFLPEEGQYGKDHVVILSHELWAGRYGADRTIVGRTIRLDNEPYIVVGVMPGGSVFDRTSFQIARPLAFAPFEVTRGLHWLNAVGRLKPDVTIEQARTHMDAMAAQFAKAYPETNNGMGVLVERFSDVLVGRELRTSFYVLFAAAGMVLLVGCANLANLALARGLSRAKEVAVRASLGGSRGRLVRQFLTENVLVAVLGGAAGVGVGYLAMAWLRLRIPPAWLPAEADIQLDSRVLVFALGISIFTGLLFGLAPALHVTKPDLTRAMKQGGRGSTSAGGRRRFRNSLVVAEVALAFMLLSGAGLLIRSFFALQDVDLGFNSTNVLTAGLPIPVAQYPDLRRLNNYLREIRDAVDQVPGVQETAMAAVVPLRGNSTRLPMQLAGTELVRRPRRGLYFFKIVSPSYFHVFGIPLRQGRAFDDHDVAGSTPVVVINERLAARLFPKQNPLGQRILIPKILPGRPDVGDDVAYQIVGVVGNERTTALTDEASEGVYCAIEQHPFYNPSLAVRAHVEPQVLQRSIRHAIDTVNKNQVMSDVRTMEQIKAESIFGTRFQTMLLSAFSAVALLLAAVGIYGVISYSVVERTHEIGLRAALGASTASLRRLVLGHGLLLTAIGLTVGGIGSLALTRVLSALLYGVGARDPLTMAAAATTLVVMSLLACYLPARRATKVDPIVALRCE